MKVIINDQVFDSETTSISLIFKDDAERKFVSGIIAGMADRDGIRIFKESPGDMSDEQAAIELQHILEIATKSYE